MLCVLLKQRAGKLSFRAAADELGVTQGAIAQQVRALEDHLNVTLFQRLPRGLSLTPEGAKYLVNITRAFDILTDSTELLLDQPDSVTISVTPTVAAKLLIPRLAIYILYYLILIYMHWLLKQYLTLIGIRLILLSG